MTTNTSQPRSMKDLSLDERRQILIDDQLLSSREIISKWNITKNTLGHIRFFHGKSSAEKRGYYHKDLMEGASDPCIEQIRTLKAEGKNSLEVSKISGLSLEKVNKIWVTV